MKSLRAFIARLLIIDLIRKKIGCGFKYGPKFYCEYSMRGCRDALSSYIVKKDGLHELTLAFLLTQFFFL